MTYPAYTDLMRLARRHSRRRGEAEDLLQDALLDAVVAGRTDLSDPGNRRWIAGVIRNRGAMGARGAARRVRRETTWAQEHVLGASSASPAPETDDILRALPPSLKILAALALSGHGRREIGYLLRLEDAALRQRIAGLRKRLAGRGIQLPELTPGLSLDLYYGRIRDALLPMLAQKGGLFASHDPDGHLIVFARSRNAGARQQRGIDHKETQP